MFKQTRRYLKISRHAARNGITLVILFSTLTLISLSIWGIGWNFWVPLIITCYIFMDFILEVFNAKHLASQLNKTDNDISSPISYIDIKLHPGEFGFYEYDNDDNYGTVFNLNESTVYIDLREDSRLEERKQVAIELVNNADEIAGSFEQFKNEQAELQKEYADEILGLKIRLIGLYAKSQPNYGEVYFTHESGGDHWFCSLIGSHFSNKRGQTQIKLSLSETGRGVF